MTRKWYGNDDAGYARMDEGRAKQPAPSGMHGGV